MNSRKQSKFILDMLLQERKNNQSDNKIYVNSSQPLTHAPNDVKSVITSFLSGNEPSRMAQLNKDFYRHVKSKEINTTGFYYAVGSNINLYEYNLWYQKRREHILKNEIVRSLDNHRGVLLFPHNTHNQMMHPEDIHSMLFLFC